ncbi:MAG: NAD(P)/FAD-dependent oxidoreductase [Rhodothermales bacterium]|nr:NAD(P)/FAD-dependent oxidoreductase [Rhodothermales bacterium]
MDSTTFPTIETVTLIIGAGAAGLAVGACLRHDHIPHILLERNNTPGSAWDRRYDRLQLHTHKQFSALPHLPYPKETPRYPSRRQVAAYLRDYARTFRLEPRYGQDVVEARQDAGRWVTTTRDTRYRSQYLVIATGQSHTPHRPTWPGMEAFPGSMLHSSEYANGSVFKGARMLVVGFGNSAAEIALDLCEHGADVAMAVRNAVNVAPRDLFGMSTHSVSVLLSRLPSRVADAFTSTLPRLVLGDLSDYGIRRLPYGGMTQIERDKTTPVLDVGTIELIKSGRITVYPGLERFDGDTVTFADGRMAVFDGVVLGTGYRQNLKAYLNDADAALDENGCARTSGRETDVSGLFFCGFKNSRGGLLREAGREARRIARLIREKGIT